MTNRPINSIEKLFDALGGRKATAARLNVSEAAICMWKASGKIPAYQYYAIFKALRSKDMEISFRLFDWENKAAGSTKNYPANRRSRVLPRASFLPSGAN